MEKKKVVTRDSYVYTPRLGATRKSNHKDYSRTLIFILVGIPVLVWCVFFGGPKALSRAIFPPKQPTSVARSPTRHKTEVKAAAVAVSANDTGEVSP